MATVGGGYDPKEVGMCFWKKAVAGHRNHDVHHSTVAPGPPCLPPIKSRPWILKASSTPPASVSLPPFSPLHVGLFPSWKISLEGVDKLGYLTMPSVFSHFLGLPAGAVGSSADHSFGTFSHPSCIRASVLSCSPLTPPTAPSLALLREPVP